MLMLWERMLMAWVTWKPMSPRLSNLSLSYVDFSSQWDCDAHRPNSTFEWEWIEGQP